MTKILTIGTIILFFGCAGKEKVNDAINANIERDTFTKVTAAFWGETVEEKLKPETPTRRTAAPPETTTATTDTIFYSGRFQTVVAGEAFDRFAAVYISQTDGKAYKAGLRENAQVQGIAIDTAFASGDTLQIITQGVIYNYTAVSSYTKNLYSNGGGAISATRSANSQKVGYLDGVNFYVEIEPFGSEIETVKRKVLTETRNNTDELDTDNELFVSLDSAQTYQYELLVFLETTNSTMDYQYSVEYTGTTSSAVHFRTHTVAGDALSVGTSVDEAKSGLVSGTAVTGPTHGPAIIRVTGIITTTSPGTLLFKWAQNTGDAGNISVLKGSFLKYTKL